MSRVLVKRDADETGTAEITLVTGTHLYTAEEQFKTEFGVVTSLERDLLTLASSVFAADRGIQRGEREDFARTIELSIPIVNAGRLQPLIPICEAVLRSLSNDRWTLIFRHQAGSPESATFREAKGQTLLFSGGLDSLAAAIEFGAQANLHLVSHITRNQQTRSTQQSLVALMAAKGLRLPHRQFFVSSRDSEGFDHDVESSQRTRSFLFLILAALVARRLGHQKILMIAENGQMAVHLPLNSARIGAFSTHTAHPDVLAKMQLFLNQAFGRTIEIANPYIGETKAETIKVVVERLADSIPVANSCWRSARLSEGKTHCGQCIPCFVRRVAIETYNPDPTAYERDVLAEDVANLDPDDEARRNLVDLCEFMLQFERCSNVEIMELWPELYSSNINASITIEMYRRAAAETRAVLSKYPRLAKFLQ